MDVPSAVVPYRPTWPSDFRELADYVRPFLAGVPHRIEHVGSTSVPGLDAKPIIDIDVVVPAATFVGDGVAALTMAGYTHQGDLGIKGREAFDVLTGFAYHSASRAGEGSSTPLKSVGFTPRTKVSAPRHGETFLASRKTNSFSRHRTRARTCSPSAADRTDRPHAANWAALRLSGDG